MTTAAEQPRAVLLERDGAVLTVRLNRPEARNSLDLPAKEALLSALAAAAADDAVRCVVLTGTGRSFCSGQDLTDHSARLRGGDAAWATVEQHYHPLAVLLATMDKPVVAAVNGLAVGAGMAMALAADVRVAGESAGFATAFAGIGLSCDSGTSWWLPRLVGAAKAKELLLLQRTVPATEAVTLGLATEVVPDAELPRRAADVAAQLAAGPTRAYGALRRAVAYSAGHSLPESLSHEAELIRSTGATTDHAEAVEAFLAKRRPTFRGR